MMKLRSSQIRPLKALPRFSTISPQENESDKDSTDKDDKKVTLFRAKRLNAEKVNPFCHDRLRALPFFCDRDPEFVTELLDDVRVEVFHPGELILKQGSCGDSMYILSRGTVDIVLGDKTVCQLEDGSIFGEIALLGVSSKRSATVRAASFCDCRVLHRDGFLRLLKRYPEEHAYYNKQAKIRLEELQKQQQVSNRSSVKSPPGFGPQPDPSELAKNLAAKLRNRRRSIGVMQVPPSHQPRSRSVGVMEVPSSHKPRRRSCVADPMQPLEKAPVLPPLALKPPEKPAVLPPLPPKDIAQKLVSAPGSGSCSPLGMTQAEEEMALQEVERLRDQEEECNSTLGSDVSDSVF
eukprot:gnl/MRDRNA2_/MRDRNA2_83930_c0_seq1.p1 gnl/MRDRNA2_/MRDRNA2_83930_c0~~gnl/MRDRNA2_/MRDRNA2_83930_c0_seq1.p1  ORF type:complete len:350 (-),score=58.42 gnl/MRDRNA2_/MRDRNA2_83930_c0_seq1:31-1080(-)